MLNDKKATTSDTNYSSIQDKHTWGDLEVGSGLVLTEGRLRSSSYGIRYCIIDGH